MKNKLNNQYKRPFDKLLLTLIGLLPVVTIIGSVVLGELSKSEALKENQIRSEEVKLED